MRVIQHNNFVEEILQFNWINSENRRFFRFYHANGLSNKQVLNRLQNHEDFFTELGFNSQFVILPFNSRKEIQTYNSVNNPIVWISLNCLNNNWYTPIHVASAIGHELAMLLGLDSSVEKISKPEYNKFKAPNFLGHLILKIASQWRHSITDIENAFEQIDISQYNYFPASTVLGFGGTKSNLHNQANFDSLIASLLIEQEALFALQDELAPSEKARLVCLEEVLLHLNMLKSKLAESSLDGSEFDFQFPRLRAGVRNSS